MSDDTIRLSKRMTELGLCSRREADEFIEQGLVKVDGVVVDVLGSRVRPEQRIELEARALNEQAERVTLLLHKPVGYVSGAAEMSGERPAWQLIKADTLSPADRSGYTFLRKHQLHLAAAGRLDVDASGLLVLTQDGRVARKLLSGDCEQEFLVWIDRPLDDAGLAALKAGVNSDGDKLTALRVSRQSDSQLCFVLREVQRRHIQRMCAAAGLQVKAVRRIRIGRVRLGELQQGQWRYLTENEKF
ncbi:pseudouridine synthase [Vogesella indigofera]|uniref:pseudouridine synthase n=1 Tax=Vogesella indigofera TaxID=45465 RepID=UPI00234DE59F|nr:S4 domain-containing protein [Vogesella indigofera]MDC7703097.1 S4 domain-containing protein [Vogesella indigofera]